MTPSVPLRTIIRRAVGLQVLAAVLIGLLAVGLWAAYRQQAEEADRARDAQIALERLRGDVLSGETGVRGFALTSASQFLDPYVASVGAIDVGARRLRDLLEPAERRALAGALAEIDQWRAEFAGPLLVRVRAGDMEGARRLARTGIGKRRTDAFRARIGALSKRVDARTRRGDRSRDRFAVIGALVILAAILTAVAASFRLQRRLTRDVVRPMQALARTAAAVGAGDLSARTPATGAVETASAAGAFNEMAAELEEVVRGLRDLDHLRTRYVGSVAHELRNPLAAVTGHLEEVVEGDLGPVPDDQREALETALRSAGRLGRLIDDLLLLSRLESGHVELSHEPVSLAELGAEVVRDFRPAAAKGGVALELLASAPGVVVGDAERLRQCLANLVSNGVKFSPPGHGVEIMVTEEADHVQVLVSDRGVGIPEAELPRIGERFFRASTAAATRGTGLGLAITKELLDRHGATLEARPREGGGTEFRVVAPAAQREPADIR